MPQEIAISINHPSVLPEDRLLRWTSPYSLSHHASLASEFPTLDIPSILVLMRDAFKKSTLISYGTGLLRFHQFCDENNISEAARMPASMMLLAAFVAVEDDRGTPGATIVTWLAGIETWHTFGNADWHGNDPIVSTLTKSACKKNPRAQR